MTNEAERLVVSETEAEDFTVPDRDAAHRALDRWLDECEREAVCVHAVGRSGYMGRIKLCAFVSDDGIAVRIERSFSEDL